MRRAQQRLFKKAGVEYKSFHTYKKTYCTMLCKKGVPLQVACKLMGPKSIDITERYYTFVDIEEKQEAANKLNSIFKNKLWLKSD